AIITVVLGVVCLLVLPVAQYPEIVPPTIQVSTVYPGASAEVVATTVGIPLEQALNGVENSFAMQSTSGSDGSYTLTLTFTVGTNLDTSIALVQNAVNGALADAERGADAGRDRPEGQHQRPADREPVLGGRSLRRDLPQQLRHHQPAGSAR